MTFKIIKSHITGENRKVGNERQTRTPVRGSRGGGKEREKMAQGGGST